MATITVAAPEPTLDLAGQAGGVLHFATALGLILVPLGKASVTCLTGAGVPPGLLGSRAVALKIIPVACPGLFSVNFCE